jgi:hypothetical protein
MALTHNKHVYLLVDSVIECCPEWCKDLRDDRHFVRQNIIPRKHYIYARYIDGALIASAGYAKKKDKIMVSRDYLYEYDAYVREAHETGYENIPEIVDGICEIETRRCIVSGETYFRSDDLVGYCAIESGDDVFDELVEGIDYRYFPTRDPIKCVLSKSMFFTYTGLLRVLFVSRTGNANKFIDWATDTLFTVQMGTAPQKQALVGKMLGASPSAVNEVFRTSATTTPCIYLFVLGTVKALRESMRIDPRYSDTMLVCKYGYTNDLPRRTTEHTKTYGTIKGADLRLVHHSYIDPMYISKAEADIRLFFEGTDMELVYKTHKELVVVDQIASKLIAHQYKQLGDKYAGHSGDLKKRINDLEHLVALKEEQAINVAERANHIVALKDEQTKNIVLQKDIELMAKDNMIAILQGKLNRSKPKKTKKGSA